MNVSSENEWLLLANPSPSARFRLFCFAYAGGSASVFNEWHTHLPDWIEVAAIVLPGSKQRKHETMPVRMGMLVRQLAKGISSELELPYALVGSCTGSLIAFELANHLRKKGMKMPAHLFVSNCRAPHLPDRDEPIHKYNDAQLQKELARLGGTPAEILNHPEMMALLGPILRADFELAETYTYRPVAPLENPITSFSGLNDQVVTHEECAAWKEHTSVDFSHKKLDGGHYLVEDSTVELCDIIGSTCKSLIE